MLIYAALNLCRVEIQPNSSDLKNLYVEADWCRPCQASGALHPEVLAPGLGQVFIAYLWYSKNTKCFYQFVHWKKISTWHHVCECLWQKWGGLVPPPPPIGGSWVQFDSMCTCRPALEDTASPPVSSGSRLGVRWTAMHSLRMQFLIHIAKYFVTGYFFHVLYLFKNVLLVPSW